VGSGSAMFFVFKRCLKCSRILILIFLAILALIFLAIITISDDDVSNISDDISDEEMISCVNIYIN